MSTFTGVPVVIGLEDRVAVGLADLDEGELIIRIKAGEVRKSFEYAEESLRNGEVREIAIGHLSFLVYPAKEET